ncbi:MAG: IS66 family insertion sequence element accessory protein TnpB [Candidatus Udaeobacter sp.]
MPEAFPAGAGGWDQFCRVLPFERSEGERVARGQTRDGGQGIDAAWAGWRCEEEGVQEEASEIHTRTRGVLRRYGGQFRPGVSSTSPFRVRDRVRQLAGSGLAARRVGSAAMMRPYGEDLKVYLCREPVDTRKGRNGLAALAQEAMKVDPFSGALLVYVGRRYNAVKILYWSRNGWALWHKLIETRDKFHWPRLLEQSVVTLSAEQLEWLLDGYDIWTQPHQMLRLSHAA